MTKLICVLSLIALCLQSTVATGPATLGSATLRMGLALVFAVALAVTVLERLGEAVED